MKDITKKYTNGEVTIVWKPSVCSHSALCWRGEGALPEVFNPKERPWIKPEGATTERIIAQVKKCPSGALSYYMNSESTTDETETTVPQVEVLPNGPLIVKGDLEITHSDGKQESRKSVTAFCRCGHSANKPYCDGSHQQTNFQG